MLAFEMAADRGTGTVPIVSFAMVLVRVARLLEGGADTGFHHVEPEEYTPRLMHFSGAGRNVVIRQVNPAASRVNA